ncbi:MAG TPA: ChaN family lipoprotein, partial [Nitrospirota bacterium]
RVLTDDAVILVQPETGGDVYAGAVSAWAGRGAAARKAADLKEADIKSSSLVVLGADNPLANRLYGKVETGSGVLTLTARKNPWNADKVVVIVQAGSAASASRALPVIIESGESSVLSVDAQGRMTRDIEGADRGIVMGLRGETTAIDVSSIKTLSDVIAKASAKRIVYVGEAHDRYAHHNLQLQIIRDLHQKDPKIAVGMEMFQRPFQQVLDDYIGGVIDEREFLKRSEYFKRWSFDYNLYKPILDFARAGKIPVVALNLRSEIIEKVSKSGMDSLTADEKKEIPASLDFSDQDYRDRLREVYGQHQGRGDRKFDFFYQAQILWDETMALSIDEYLRKNPDHRMVVIAGIGHLAYGAGIPKRAQRRNGLDFATILPDANMEQNIADYLVFPQPLEGVSAPRLMVMLKEDAGRVLITALSEGGAARKAGIRSGDALVSLDGAPIGRMEDVKIALFYKKHEETIRVKVIRKRFLLGDKEMEFDVKLP